MISDAVPTTAAPDWLVRCGAMAEVVRCRCELVPPPARASEVVVDGPHGIMLGTALGPAPYSPGQARSAHRVLRAATADDCRAAAEGQARARAEFDGWVRDIARWGIPVELVDLEYTLDGALRILYVLTSRGPDTTRLALAAAAEGRGPVSVQPVSHAGLMPVETAAGTGRSCGCDSGGCHVAPSDLE